MVGDQVTLHDQLGALQRAVASNAEQIMLLQTLFQQQFGALVHAVTALTITVTEVIEAEPDRHASPASEERAAALYKLSIAQRRSAAAHADPADVDGPRPFSGIATG